MLRRWVDQRHLPNVQQSPNIQPEKKGLHKRRKFHGPLPHHSCPCKSKSHNAYDAVDCLGQIAVVTLPSILLITHSISITKVSRSSAATSYRLRLLYAEQSRGSAMNCCCGKSGLSPDLTAYPNHPYLSGLCSILLPEGDHQLLVRDEAPANCRWPGDPLLSASRRRRHLSRWG